MNDGSAALEVSSELAITITPYGSIKYFTNDDPIGVALSRYGEWAGLEIEFLSQFIKKGSTVVDVGANIGTHTLAFSKFVGIEGVVYSFEPQPEVFDVLSENIKYNNLKNVVALRYGVGREIGLLFCDKIDHGKLSNIGGVALRSYASEGALEVRIQSIDELALESCDFIKVDAEGMESDVIGGMRNTLVNHKPILFIECNHVLDGLRIMAELENAGYEFFLVASPAFNPDNRNKSRENFFGVACEKALLCIPTEKESSFDLVGDFGSIKKINDFDEFACMHVAVPRYGDANEYVRDCEFLRSQVAHLQDKLNSSNESDRILQGRLNQLSTELVALQCQLVQSDDRASTLEDQLRRLTFRNKSLQAQVDSLLFQLNSSLAGPAHESYVGDVKASRSAWRKSLSRRSALWIREPIRRVRFSINKSLGRLKGKTR